MSYNIQDLTTHYHEHRDTYPEPFRLRIHRALSWLKRAERDDGEWMCESLGKAAQHAKLPWDRLPEDWDIRFIALWVAFNAAYANEIDGRQISADKHDLRTFLQKLCQLDNEQQLQKIVWDTFSGSIRVFLDNPYVFQAFWDYQNGKTNRAAWEENFTAAKRKAQAALLNQDTATVLLIIFERLYTLRNQIIHGGATYNSSANRHQLKEACAILGGIVPVILHIMMSHPDQDWGKPFYPFIQGA